MSYLNPHTHNLDGPEADGRTLAERDERTGRALAGDAEETFDVENAAAEGREYEREAADELAAERGITVEELLAERYPSSTGTPDEAAGVMFPGPVYPPASHNESAATRSPRGSGAVMSEKISAEDASKEVEYVEIGDVLLGYQYDGAAWRDIPERPVIWHVDLGRPGYVMLGLDQPIASVDGGGPVREIGVPCGTRVRVYPSL